MNDRRVDNDGRVDEMIEQPVFHLLLAQNRFTTTNTEASF
jgi:hypothetical protein